MTWRKTPKQLAKRALRLLGINDEKITGVVINQVDPDELGESQGLGLLTLGSQPAVRRAA
jgi:Mrp family chromosome partitioning ATPase